MRLKLNIYILSLVWISGCGETDIHVESVLKKQNQKGEYINRTSAQVTTIPPMEPALLTMEPESISVHFPKITKEYFRCKGSPLNAMRSEVLRGEVMRYHDCGGAEKHSLPIQYKKEWIYPILIDLLNDIQLTSGNRVVITSGHRCPDHNIYVDSSPQNQFSKHQIGAEVNFYVQGFENKPDAIIGMIFNYYRSSPKYAKKKEFIEFLRYEKEDTNVMTKPWMNKEIFIKLFKSNEGRNYDNRHPYPYISVQVRYDLDKAERVAYSWEQAFRNFLRY